ncbi:helix-turn-helix transcriptional regulator [candidate division WWE3 bacterium]|nr:helix-turn-helix transcriptional regulator [candidate division WWE3 bacterium]
MPSPLSDATSMSLENPFVDRLFSQRPGIGEELVHWLCAQYIVLRRLLCGLSITEIVDTLQIDASVYSLLECGLIKPQVFGLDKVKQLAIVLGIDTDDRAWLETVILGVLGNYPEDLELFVSRLYADRIGLLIRVTGNTGR